MKTFGLIGPRSMGGRFEAHVRALLAGDAALGRIILPLLEAWRSPREQTAELSRQILAQARRNQHGQLLMSIPGVGAIAATSYPTLLPSKILQTSSDRARSAPGSD